MVIDTGCFFTGHCSMVANISKPVSDYKRHYFGTRGTHFRTCWCKIPWTTNLLLCITPKKTSNSVAGCKFLPGSLSGATKRRRFWYGKHRISCSKKSSHVTKCCTCPRKMTFQHHCNFTKYCACQEKQNSKINSKFTNTALPRKVTLQN